MNRKGKNEHKIYEQTMYNLIKRHLLCECLRRYRLQLFIKVSVHMQA